MRALRCMLVVGLAIVGSCSDATWEPFDEVPASANSHWYGNGASIWWTPPAFEKYQAHGLTLLQQQFGAGIETSIPMVDDPSHIPPLSFVGVGDPVIVRPSSIQFDLVSTDNTVEVDINFAPAVWLVDILGSSAPCTVTASIQTLQVGVVLVPGRDMAGHITLNVDPSNVNFHVDSSQVLFAPECAGVEKQGVAFLIEQSVINQLNHVLIEQPTFLAGIEHVVSQLLGVSVTQRLRVSEARAPLGSGRLELTLQTMSTDGSEPVFVVADDHVTIPLGVTVQSENSLCGTEALGEVNVPPSMAPPVLSPDLLTHDVVVALRMDLMEHLFAALGPSGMWCLSKGFDDKKTIQIKDVQSVLTDDITGFFGGQEAVSIQAELRGAAPSIAWKEEASGDVAVDMNFPSVELALYVRLWHMDWLLVRESFDVSLQNYRVALDATGPLALRLVDGSISVTHHEGLLDEETIEGLIQAVSRDYRIVTLPDVVPYHLSQGRVTRHEDFLLLQMNLDESIAPRLKTQASAVRLKAGAESNGSRNMGCSISREQSSSKAAVWLFVLGFAVLFWIRFCSQKIVSLSALAGGRSRLGCPLGGSKH